MNELLEKLNRRVERLNKEIELKAPFIVIMQEINLIYKVCDEIASAVDESEKE